MSLSTTDNRRDYTGDGSTVAFSLPVLFYASSHVKVYLDGVLQASGYTVTGAGDAAGGTVTFSVAPASGVKIALIREVPFTQTSSYPVAGAFPAKTNEKDHDIGTMWAQQLNEEVDRALRAPISTTGFSGEIPNPNTAANQSKVLRIKADGTGIDGVAITSADSATVLTTKGDMIVRDATVPARLPVGANETILEADSAESLGVKWGTAPIKKAIVDAKGDLIVATAADTVARKAVGTNGEFLVAKSGDASGVDWDTVNDYTEDTTPDRAADFAMVYDASASAHKKVLLGRVGGPTLATEQAVSGVGSVTFSGIPAWARRITISLIGISSDSAGNFTLQIGDSGGLEATGYNGAQGAADGVGAAITNFGTSFLVWNTMSAAVSYSGQLTLVLEDPSDNTWSYMGMLASHSTADMRVSTGYKSLSATLDRLNFGTTAGLLDAGVINIAYE